MDMRSEAVGERRGGVITAVLLVATYCHAALVDLWGFNVLVCPVGD